VKQVVHIIGAGLAGSEAAWQVAKQGVQVILHEMRPYNTTPAHHTDTFAELVCSNSLRSNMLENAVGLLKEEMRQLDSLIMNCADQTKVPAGGALAVDREQFSQIVTERLVKHANISVIREEVCRIPEEGITVIASGPLTSPGFSEYIRQLTGEEYFYFYDAAAPIVSAESIDMSKVYRSSRYDRGEADYLNCPMTKEEYELFWQELTHAEMAPIKEFEKAIFFEGCMPVEEMASRGIDTLRYGPLKPVGLVNPHTGQLPYAVVQLRQDNHAGTLYNLVGFQTHLKWPEQQRVFSLIPGLEQAEFLRYGVMHRNTFINSPRLLEPTLQLRRDARVFFAGQITGVEGYIESAANGLVAGINAGLLARGKELIQFPEDTAHGAMCRYITSADPKHFQPMNVNFGLLPAWGARIKDKRSKNRLIAERALTSLVNFKQYLENIIA
jgi:methylenetetrahydrofolate--tRNA-(uracil-5-)-methyltransferase